MENNGKANNQILEDLYKTENLSELKHNGTLLNLDNGYYLKDYRNDNTNEYFCVLAKLINKGNSIIEAIFEKMIINGKKQVVMQNRINPESSKIVNVLNIEKLKHNEDFWIGKCSEKEIIIKTVRNYEKNIHIIIQAWRVNLQTKMFDTINNLEEIYITNFEWHEQPFFLK